MPRALFIRVCHSTLWYCEHIELYRIAAKAEESFIDYGQKNLRIG